MRLVIFRAGSLSDGVTYLGAMFGGAPGVIWDNMIGSMFKQCGAIIGIAVICCFDWKRILFGWQEKLQMKAANILFALKVALLALLAVISVSFTVASTYNPFIYFNF